MNSDTETYRINSIDDSRLTMWYDHPASVWNEALPVGNGRLGAMVFGGPANDKLQLNEDTFWSGGPSRNDNPKALEVLPLIRQLIFDGQYKEAERFINDNITASSLHGSVYQTIGNIHLFFPGHKNYTNYRRELNLRRAIFTASYIVDGVRYSREVFASAPDEVIVVRLTADKPGKISFTAGVDSPLKTIMNIPDSKNLELHGQSSTHEGVIGQVKFTVQVKILNVGGNSSVGNESINVSNADEVVILISIGTNFVNYLTLTGDENARCVNTLSAAASKSYADIVTDHVAHFTSYFDRSTIELGTSPAASSPTDVRIRNFANSNDPELVSLYYQFGRYLLISSSQPGTQPANLQGIWNGSTFPPWDSKYTLNINAEMNYWPAEKCNLSELHDPLIQMLTELSQAGQETARTMYDCDGWTAHHNTDIWRICGVVDGAFWGMWPMGGAWLSQHLWERYQYSGSLDFLKKVYPVLKSACKFYMDFLIEDPIHNWLVVSPSISPENTISNHGTSITAGATMDNQILFDLFSRSIQAASLLNTDSTIVAEFQGILDKLPPMQIGRFGQLQEWIEDWDDPMDTHRHVSHLYALFPGNQISPYDSPELFDAARTTLEHRGDASTGWSMGWKINLWARLLDGNHAFKLIIDQLSLVDPTVTEGETGGTYPNFLDAHPPFQIDGNFGFTAGIAEMLLQSHSGSIHILPALPDIWSSSGRVTGLRAYGGFEVDFQWTDGKIYSLIIHSSLGGNCRIRVPNELRMKDGSLLTEASGVNPNPFFTSAKIKAPVISAQADLNEVTFPNSYLFDVPTEPGKTYMFVSK